MEITEANLDNVEELLDFVVTRTPLADRAMIRGAFGRGATSYLRALTVRGDDGMLAGLGTGLEFPGTPAGMRLIHIRTRADLGGRGIGGRLFGELLEDLGDTTRLGTGVFDDDDRSLAVARHWGFEVAQLSITTSADLSSASWPTPASGLRLEACDDLSFDDDDAVEAMLLASQTNPEFDLGAVTSLGSLRTMPIAGQRLVAAIARLDTRPAAISVAVADGDQMHVLYTGVDRTLRGRGLGLLTKQALHAHARDLGIRRALTDNEEHNAGIRHVNDQLGYTRFSGMHWLLRDWP